jgi:hypothetical protein
VDWENGTEPQTSKTQNGARDHFEPPQIVSPPVESGAPCRTRSLRDEPKASRAMN